MCITEEQIAAIRQILGALEILYVAAEKYKCKRGNDIISDLVRTQATSEICENSMKLVGEMLDIYEGMVGE